MTAREPGLVVAGGQIVIAVHLKSGMKAEVPGAKTAEWKAVGTPHGSPTMLCKSGAGVLAQFLADDVAGCAFGK